jgi:hypothetical protein
MWTALAIRLFAVINETPQALNGGVREQAFLIIGATVVVLGGINAKAEERPAFERFGFPITQTEVAVLGSAGVRERSPTPRLMLYGMPASPHQVAVLSPHPRSVKTTGLAPPPATPR